MTAALAPPLEEFLSPRPTAVGHSIKLLAVAMPDNLRLEAILRIRTGKPDQATEESALGEVHTDNTVIDIAEVDLPERRSDQGDRELPAAMVEVEEEPGRVTMLHGGATVEQVVAALNAIGVSPRDMITILQAIKAAGALYGELEIL